MTLCSLNVNIPRYVLERTHGSAELGIFASLAYLLVAINLVIGALGQAVTSRLAHLFAMGDSRSFSRILGKLLIAVTMALILGMPVAKLVGRPLLSFIYRPEYGEYVSLFVIMVATAGLSSVASLLGYAITAARIFRMQVPVIGAATLITLLSSLILIPRAGINGAAYSLMLGTAAQAAGSAVLLRRAVNSLPRCA
jgi:O-antigen/teichoic acid export membrane protein